MCQMTTSSLLNTEACCRQIEAEYREMPGLCLTMSQIQRRWGLDGVTADAVLTRLLESGFLVKAKVGYTLSREARSRVIA